VIVAVPAATPFTMPDVAPMVATDTSLLDHVPPVVALLSEPLAPVQKVEGPMIGGRAAAATKEKNTVLSKRLRNLINIFFTYAGSISTERQPFTISGGMIAQSVRENDCLFYCRTDRNTRNPTIYAANLRK
jgi:hypothetical protein